MRECQRIVELYGSPEVGYEEIEQYYDTAPEDWFEECKEENADIRLVISINDTEREVSTTIYTRQPGQISFEEGGTFEDDYDGVLQSIKDYGWEVQNMED